MLSFLFENGFWEGERFDFETENDSSRSRDQTFSKARSQTEKTSISVFRI